ncbi:MAG: aspartate carbamoyltransferase regulatory subunit [Solobacterium sp.]|nr:aspartate carbamoyltransferase regulatory subunit [Solobacterium sp.]MBQ9153456.1 aspartate carbamoyltransferase regulatory subunit [Solobacterium sp.]
MNIDSIRNGIVIDHISAGKGMKLVSLLELDRADVSVAIIKNVHSQKMGKKDIIKIDADIPVNLDVIGYVDPDATVNVIKDGVLVEKKTIERPKILTGVIRCKNPRCITTTEQELKHVFCLRDDGYRCMYCETKAE